MIAAVGTVHMILTVSQWELACPFDAELLPSLGITTFYDTHRRFSANLSGSIWLSRERNEGHHGLAA